MAQSSSAGADKKVIIKSSDGDEFEVESIVALQSGVMKKMVEMDYTTLPVPLVNSKNLEKIIEYMKKHAASETSKGEINDFDNEFVNTKYENLFELASAANYLDLTPLFELIGRTIADRIQNKSVKAVRTIFSITDACTEEEEQKLKSKAPWAYEGDFDDTLE